MDAALAAVLPRSFFVGASAIAARAAEAATRTAGINSKASRLPSTSSSSPSSSPKLQDLVLVSDSLGADAAFVVSHLLLKCLRDDGKRVVLVATAESGQHHEAVLKKLGLSLPSLSSPLLKIVPLWDDDALWMPDSMRLQSCGATGLRRASEAIREAMIEGGGEDEDESEDNTVLVFDSLSALQAAARDAREWEGFVAREVLGARASCVVARTDCVPGDERGRAGGGGNGGDGDGDGGEDDEDEANEPSSSSQTPPWLAALRSAASVELTTRPLASGAAIDVSGVLIARRGATAAVATMKQGVEEEETTLAPLSLGPATPLFAALPPPRSRAVFNYRLVDAAVRLVPRRTL